MGVTSSISIKNYNNTKQSTIAVSPNQATQGNDNIEIWLNINNKASFNRKYAPLRRDSQARTYVKPGSFKKGYDSKWSKNMYKVAAITEDQKQFTVKHNNSRRLYLRHVLLLVRGVAGKDI